MTIRELIKKDFGVDLPVKGELGNSIDNPLIIERTKINDYVSTEFAFLKYIGIGRRITWKLISQALMSHNGRMIDKVKIETKQITETEVITQIENYYFDISDCLGQLAIPPKSNYKKSLLDKSGENDSRVLIQEKYQLIESFFTDQQDYLDFLLSRKQRIISNEQGSCFAEITKHGEYFNFTLTWNENGKYIGEHIKPFRATPQNIALFNKGVKRLSELLRIYLETNDINSLPNETPFGPLTYIQ
jgi:hypothetical protein